MNVGTCKTLIVIALAVLVAVPTVAQTRTDNVQIAPRTCAVLVGQFVTNITAGEVAWVTDNGSEANFADCPIPAGFFGEGSEELGNLTIRMTGEPLSSATGQADTLVEVSGVNCLKIGDTKSMTTEIQAMHMRSIDPVPVVVDGATEDWDLDVHVTNAQNTGSITLTLDDDNGGTFTSSLPVQAKLVWTSLDTGEVKELVDPSCEIHFDSANATPWALARDGGFDPDAAGLPPVPAGVGIDGDGDGVDDYITNGRTNFVPGIEVVTGSGLIAGATLDDGTTTTVTTSFTWKYWLFRELYLLFKHLVWPKPIPFVAGREVVDAEEVDVLENPVSIE